MAQKQFETLYNVKWFLYSITTVQHHRSCSLNITVNKSSVKLPSSFSKTSMAEHLGQKAVRSSKLQAIIYTKISPFTLSLLLTTTAVGTVASPFSHEH